MGASTQNLSDEQLVSMISQGAIQDNQDAFDELLERYRKMMRAHTAHASRAGLDADDVMQECALALMDAVKGYDPDAGFFFAAYARQCVSNRIISAIRGAGAAKRRPLYDYVELSENTAAAPDGDPAERLAAKETAEELRRSMLTRLSPTEKAVFERYLTGESYMEIGEALSINYRAVDNAIQRARRKLQNFGRQ